MKRGVLLILLLALLLSGCYEWLPTLETGSTEESSFASTPESTSPTDVSTSVPTESFAESVPLPVPADTDFVLIRDYIPHVRVELAYATDENFTGQIIYNFTQAYLRYGTLRKLEQAAEVLLSQGYGIVIWDAYRPVYAQQALWDICPDPNYVSPPGTGSQSHCRGCAVDITLYDLESGELLEMPTGFDNFTSLADRDYSDATPSAAANARLLEDILSQAGFSPYFGEWWHFTDTDIASYAVSQDFDPAA